MLKFSSIFACDSIKKNAINKFQRKNSDDILSWKNGSMRKMFSENHKTELIKKSQSHDEAY